MNPRRRRCVLVRSVRNPKVLCRWVRLNWMRRVRIVEKEIGGEIQAC